MPIYEYRCDKCGLEKEYLQKLGAPAVSACPCGESTMTKLISAAGFQLKGSGWYATDFKTGGKTAAPKSEGDGSESKTAAPKSEGDGSESKPAAPKSEGGGSESKPAESTSSGRSAAGPAPSST